MENQEAYGTVLRTCGDIMYYASQQFPKNREFMNPEQQVHCNVYDIAAYQDTISDVFDELLACYVVWQYMDPIRSFIYRWYLGHIVLPG